MIAENITGGITEQIEDMGKNAAKYVTDFLFVASAMFALVSALMLDAGLRQVFHFFKARKHYDNKFIDQAAYRSAVVKFCFGIAMIVGTITVLVLLNWARANAIDGGGDNPILVYALIALSVFAGIAFGIAKKELAEISELRGLAKKWYSIRQAMASVHASMTELSIRIQNQLELVINKAHCLGVDLQELMEREYDERDQELAAQFREEVRNGKFHITNAQGSASFNISPTDAYYYRNLITNEVFLHRNYFATHERLSVIAQEVNSMMAIVNKMENARLTRLSKSSDINGDHQATREENSDSRKELIGVNSKNGTPLNGNLLVNTQHHSPSLNGNH